KDTDRESIYRIKRACINNEEIVELLLNYRKDGRPFWNLLLIAPLADENGKVRYFLGAQIDVTDHIATGLDFSDESRHPSAGMSPTSATTTNPEIPRMNKVDVMSRLKRFFTRTMAGSRDRSNSANAVGAENEITINEMKDVRDKEQPFYQTFSKYLILEPHNGTMLYASKQLIESLQMGHSNTSNAIIGKEFIDHFVGPLTKRTSRRVVSNALRDGRAVSETIVSKAEATGGTPMLIRVHMTPLKDAQGQVGYFVAVMAVDEEGTKVLGQYAQQSVEKVASAAEVEEEETN
ncbi:hypothetical protein HK102_011485, partial [Quaeritorhiza haematococci]